MFEGGGEDDFRPVADEAGEFQPIEFGHLDVEEDEIDVALFQAVESFHGAGASALKGEEGGAFDVGHHQFQRQRLIIDYEAVEVHGLRVLICSCAV